MKTILLYLRALILASLVVSLSSCGGGGGGGGGETGPTYSGITDMAVITNDNAVELAVGALFGGPSVGGVSAIAASAVDNDAGKTVWQMVPFPYPLPLIQELQKRPGSGDSATERLRAMVPYSETNGGNCGGREILSLNIDDTSGHFTGTLTFENFCEDGETAAGTIKIVGDADPWTGDILSMEMSFDQLMVEAASGSVTMSGKASGSLSSSGEALTMNYRIRDNGTGKVYKVENYVATRNEGPDWEESTYSSGKFYHPDFGYVSVSTVVPFLQYEGDIGPSSGELLITGASSTKASLVIMNANTFEVMADTNGDGTFEWSSGPLNWIADNMLPVADAGPDQEVETDSFVTLDGGGSDDPEGKPLTYHWSLVSTPPGSTTDLSDPTLASPTFFADLDGVYIARLVVNNGTFNSVPDSVTVTAAEINYPPLADAGPDQTVPTTARVQLDGSYSSDINNDTLSYDWTLTSAPEGSTATLSDAQIMSPTFIADVDGLYVLTLVVNDGTVDSPPDQVAVTAQAQKEISPLAFRVTDAEYSTSLDRIVMVSASPANSLHLHDPLTGADTAVGLPLPPTSVSVGPDGLYAAVGHNGWISYVDLATATLVKTFAVSTDVLDIVLAGNGYVYAFPRRDQWENIRCVNIATEEETLGTGQIYAGTVGKLHPDGTAIYGADNGLSPSDIEKYDISSGTAAYLYDSPYHGDYPMCGDLWFSEDGQRIFTRCGYVFRSSPVQSEDMTYNGSLSNTPLITHLSHSSALGQIIAIPAFSEWSSPGVDDRELHVYNDNFLGFVQAVALPSFIVDHQPYPAHGKYVFVAEDGSNYFVVVQADAASGLLQDFGVVVY